jgi:F-type H+-transporting ATPase subunit beta
LKDALDGCERILRDEFKDYPESALYMIGAVAKRKKERNVANLSPQADGLIPKPDPKPKPEVERAAADPHES